MTGLTSIDIPKSVTYVGSGAFSYCDNLREAVLPINACYSTDEELWIMEGVETHEVYDSTFTCSPIEKVVLIESDIKEYEFENGDSSIGYVLPSELKECVIAYGVKKIPNYALGGCTGLTSITIPDSVTGIGKGAFYKCTGLTSITIPDSVTSIGDNAFEKCSKLTGITIPKKITNIGKNAFKGCRKIEKITIPESVKTIKASAFDDCDGLKNVYYKGSKEQWEKIKIYSGNDDLKFASIHYAKITKVPLTKAKISGIKNKVYNGKAQAQKISVKLGKTTLKFNRDYTISYRNNKNVGTASITIKGKGNYSGSVTKTFYIVPKGTSIKKLSRGSKKFTAYWNRISGITGYQIQYSLKSNMKSSKTVTVKGYKNTKKTVNKLKKGKKYYVRIRGYKKIGKKMYYSNWSSKKTVKVK